MATTIPDDLLRFIDANIESVEQLEILRVLAEASAPMTATDLAQSCQIQPASIVTQLAALEQRGLLRTALVNNQINCSQGASDPNNGTLLARLLQYYRERPVTLIRLIYARANERLKAFSEAFRLRKDNR